MNVGCTAAKISSEVEFKLETRMRPRNQRSLISLIELYVYFKLRVKLASKKQLIGFTLLKVVLTLTEINVA
jgi:hypothetical protein